MKSKIWLLLFLMHSFVWLYGQEPIYKTYEWGKAPKIPSDVESEKVILKNLDIIEFIFEGEFFLEYQIKHLVEFINSDEQVKRNNKRYVPFNESSELVEAKIRVVNPNNEIITLDESKILTAIDENTQQTYKYFALEGLEAGSIIDYYYVVKKYPNYNGIRKFIQDEYFTEEYIFELYCPPHLGFAFKVYNDTNQVSIDTTSIDKNHWTLKLKSVGGLKEEEQSLYKALLKQLVFKLDNNIANNTKDLSSYGIASTNIYNRIYSLIDKQDQKAINSFLKELKINGDASIDDKIFEIENYIKSNINLVNNNEEQYSKISSIIKLKSATKIGIIRLMIRSFEEENIKFQIVLTCDRTISLFDKEFESFHNITDYMIYFPETDKYLAPDLFEYRYGLVPWEFTDNYGLFIKETSLGDFKTGIGKVRFIPPIDYGKSYHNIEAIAQILPDFSMVDIQIKNYSSGYYAVVIQPYYDLISEDIKENIMTDNFKQFFVESEIKEWNVQNGSAKYLCREPFIQEYKATTTELIDKAGDKYILKAGKLIGRQSELYSEVARELPINNEYKRMFYRKLTIEIPENYVVKNIDDLNVYIDYIKNGEKNMLFESKYVLDGRKIMVDVMEYYDRISYSVDEYDIYRKVVNSAADFEKIVLILEKE